MEQANQAILLERRDRVALLTLNRPTVMNAINTEIRTGLMKFIADIDQDPQLAVVVIAGAGDRGFCVGADIKEARSIGTSVAERQRMMDLAWADAVYGCTKPVIAAVHGFCLGGGLELALACDIRIAAPGAVFGLPETALGLIPGGGGTQRLPRIVGAGRALDMILTGERIKAEEALRIGLVTRLAASGDSLLEEALKLAAHVAARPPVASAYAKEAIRKGMEMNIADGLDLEKTLFSMLMTTEDRAEAAKAFAEKRPPKFQGR